jgi:hypothetical protein
MLIRDTPSEPTTDSAISTCLHSLQPYGKIQDMTVPTPVPAGSLRSSTITFKRIRSAAIARNVMHGFEFSSDQTASSKTGTTRLHTMYEQPLQVHVIRNWLSSHPKIVLPVIVFLLGTLTYTVHRVQFFRVQGLIHVTQIFDPIRALMVEGKILNWFDIRGSCMVRLFTHK